MELVRHTGVSERTAGYVVLRLRGPMTSWSRFKRLDSTVKVDEMYLGATVPSRVRCVCGKAARERTANYASP